MSELFLPVLAQFEEDNLWTASVDRFRYKVVPDVENRALNCEGWEGPWAYEFSQVERRETFPLSEEGLEQLRSWVVRQAAEINARPRRTMAEDLARREAALARQREKED